MQLDNNSLIMQWNTDTNGNPVSKHIPREVQQVSPTHNLIQLTQIPDEFYPLRIVTEDNVELKEVKHRNDMTETAFCVDYGMGLVYFDSGLSGKMVIINYYGRGVMLISDSRIFHKDGDTIADTWDNILERSQDALDLIEHAGGLANAIKVIDQKVDEGTQIADRLENFITETQFYGYTITLSREAFVVKADDNGEVGKTETSSVYTDVLVYKGGKQIIPTLAVSNEYGCAFKVEGQRVKLTSIDVNLIKVNAILNIDCGDGLVAQRVLEVTKVFDGVSQYEVSMTNPFYSFQANSEGYIEESQSIECTFKVSKANIDYENYTVQIQNLPQGLNYEIKKGSIVFTAISGRLLPSSGSCSVVLTIDGQSFNKPFTWNKTKKGQDAKSLTLVGNQIIRYEQPDYSDIPLQTKTTVSAKVVGLSGTPIWSFYNGTEWSVLVNETGLDLTFAHNDILVWADRKEVTIKCELDGYYDELTIVKLANGLSGNDAITVVLTNESHTVAIDDSGYVESTEIENARTNVLVYKGANSVTPKITKGECSGCDIAITGNMIQLVSLDNSFTSSTAEIVVEVEGVIVSKVWTISKSKQGLQGENGQNGKTYILNVTGGTRSVTYSQINHDPRPAYSFAFTGSLYENGVEIIEDVSWYWVANGHFEGSSVTKRFTPTIKKVFDETVINNSISVMATYNGQTLTQDIPLSVTKDAYGLDWVSEWDSTKVDVRGSLILTPKIFAGHYDQENDLITGVAIGKDVLNNGRTVGVVGYQNNVPSFLLDTDGSLQVGNPFGEDSTGLYYNEGVFKLKVNELSIEGAKVPTENEIGNLVASEINSAKNELQETINGLNNSLGSLEDVVNNSLQDGILTEVEKHSLKTVIDTINGEVNTVVAQSNSILINPYLSNTTLMLKLEELLGNYEATHNTLVEIYVRITNSDIPTDEDIALFNTALSDLRVISDELNQVLIDCLTNISQTQAQQLVDKAKEEIQAEVSDVNDALSDLENTINTDFKAGLVTSINITNLENHLQQLAKEKVDLDSQYSVIYNNTNLSTTIKSKLLQAKSNYDIAHDSLVAKINSAIADNLMTEQELQEINTLISSYTEKLGTYSGVAQEANADIALNSAKTVVEALDQEAVFNKLTNNGEVQGIYLQDKKVYINGEYVNTRNLKAVKSDGTETFKIDSEGNVSIKAKSFILTGDATTNVATEDYVNNAVSQVSNGAINIILSNESQVISTNANSVPLANQSFAIKVQMYKSTNEVTDFTIGTVSSINGISASVSQSTKTVTFSVSTSTTIGAVSGKITIPIVYNGKTYNKEWSWAIAKQGTSGTSGSAGADAKYVTVSGEQVFKYTNNFTGTPTPSSITLTANVYNTTSTGKWQYSNGSSWVDCNVTAKTLTVQPTSYTLSSLKRVTVRYIVDNVYDTFTVVAVSDGANGVNGTNGIDGADGKGIVSITEQYYHSTSMTTQTGGTWSTTVPTATRGKYIWTRSVIKYTDTTTTTTTPICVSGSDGTNGNNGVDGVDGTDGVSITSVDVEYAQNTSTTTAPTSGWTTTSPTWASGKYIWSRTKTTYSDGKTTYTNPACITGQKGDTGASGKGIKSIAQYYLATSLSTGVTTLTSGWSTSIQSITSTKKYLWNYETILYTDGNSTSTVPVIIGVYGDKGQEGNGIKSITEYYLATNLSSGVTASTSGWTTTIQTPTSSKKYLWNYEVIAYTSGDSQVGTPRIVGNYARDGVDGVDGADGTSSYFYVRYSANSNGSSMTTSPTSTSKYMGVCSTTSTTAPTDYTKYTWTLIKGADGTNGSPGANGSDGKTSYLHIKYSNDGKTFTSNNGEDIGIYIGTYVDFNQADSNIFNNYTWKKFVGEDGQDGKDGADAITIVLTNENHTFSANSSGNIASTQSTTTNITAYKGASTTSVTIGTLPTVTGLTLSKSGSTVTIQANTGTSLADTGTLSIPLTVDGKSFTKNFSWTKVKAGATGATGSAGTNAKVVDIIASSMVFKSADGGTTFSPSTITLTPKLQNLTYSNWQYSTNGGSSWTTVTSGSNGLTISSGVLTISKDSALYTSSVTSVAFRVNTNDSAYYDVVTIVKLYDVGELEIGGRNLISQTKLFANINKGAWTVANTGNEGFKKLEIVTTDTGWLECQIPVNAEINSLTSKLTISFEYYESNVGILAFSLGAYNGSTRLKEITNVVVSTEFKVLATEPWKRVSYTFDPTSINGVANATRYQVQFKKQTGKTGTVYVRKPKLEIGTTATDWSPAPEDVSQEIADKVEDYDNSLNQLKVFNKLTNNGQTQGIYLENSKLYINGEYIKAKSISGDKISAGVITATNGKSTINLDNGAMNLGNTTNASYLQWTGSDLNIKAKSLSIGATSVATTTDVNNATSGKVDKNKIISSINQTAEAVKINANKIELTGEVVANAINGGSTTINGSKITTGTITANQINTKTLTADMITSGTFKGTNFLAGGSTNGEGYIQVLDASNSIKMIASKNGIFATSIQFPESITISGAVKTNGVIEANGTGFHSSFRETGTNYTINYQAQLTEGALSVTQESDFGGSSSLSTIKITGDRININGVLLQNKGANLQLNCPLRIVGNGSVDKRVATVTSLGTVYLGDETTDTSVLSKNAPNWWNGSTFRELLHTGGGQTISGGNLGISAGGLNVGTGTNTEGYTISNNRNINNVHHRASLSVYNTDNGIASLFYRNMSTSIEKGVGVKASSSTSGYFIPSHNNQLSCGTASYKWTYIYATNGTIQTSDERFKIKRGYADTNDCYDMVKNTQLYNYTMIGENKENLSQNRLGKLAMARNEDETNVHIGVMAQDLQNYGCGKKILVEGEYEKQDGTKDTMLHINPLDMSMAILGGLQKEIQIRDEQYEELKQENETLKNELAEIKRMLMAQTLI